MSIGLEHHRATHGIHRVKGHPPSGSQPSFSLRIEPACLSYLETNKPQDRKPSWMPRGPARTALSRRLFQLDIPSISLTTTQHGVSRPRLPPHKHSCQPHQGPARPASGARLGPPPHGLSCPQGCGALLTGALQTRALAPTPVSPGSLGPALAPRSLLHHQLGPRWPSRKCRCPETSSITVRTLPG